MVTAPSAETIQSRVLGAQTATRSPASTPDAMHAAAARSTRSPSSVYVIRVRPSTTASRPPYRCAAARTRFGTVDHSSSPRISCPPVEPENRSSHLVADYPSD